MKAYSGWAAIWVVLASGCGGSGGGGSSNATVSITSPTSGSSVALGTDAGKSVTVSFTLTGFTLKAPGTCAGAANCGHLHVVIDDHSSACNQTANGSENYNAQITSGTSGSAEFALCGAGAAGTHSLTLEIHDDAHNDVKDSSGNLIKSTVTGITTHP